MSALKINQKTKTMKTTPNKHVPIEIQSFSVDNLQQLIQEQNQIFNDRHQHENYRLPTDIFIQKDSFQQTFKEVLTPSDQNQINWESSCSQLSKIQNSFLVQTKEWINTKPRNSKSSKLRISIKKNTKKRTDQYIFKRRHTIIKQCLKKLNLRQLTNKYQSYRKDYFILTMSLIQSRNMMQSFAEEYDLLAINALKQIDQLLKAQNCQQVNIQNQTIAKVIIEDSRLIVEQFCNGNPKEAFDMIYNVNSMTRTQDYITAKALLNKERHKLGLSLV